MCVCASVCKKFIASFKCCCCCSFSRVKEFSHDSQNTWFRIISGWYIPFIFYHQYTQYLRTSLLIRINAFFPLFPSLFSFYLVILLNSNVIVWVFPRNSRGKKLFRHFGICFDYHANTCFNSLVVCKHPYESSNTWKWWEQQRKTAAVAMTSTTTNMQKKVMV